MFRTVGDARTPAQDRRLAGYLALIAGMVNSAGFVLMGAFTSHVTGNVGRFAGDAALGHFSTAWVAAGAIFTFFLGAFTTSFVAESGLFASIDRASAALLALEASLIAAFVVLVGAHVDRWWEPLLLSGAMGMQNSLVTRLSGAIVRTTHLTGVVTDIGIESARWLRHFTANAERPKTPKIALLATIFATFVLGSATGAVLVTRWQYDGLVPAIALLLGGAVYARRSGAVH